jgi:acyl-CoA thioesterase
MSALHPFDQAIALEETGPGQWRGAAIDAYGNMVGAFGGVVAATLLNAVLRDGRHQGHPVSLTVNFCAALALAGFAIQTTLQRGGKYTQHWSLVLTQGDTVCATASVVMGTRGEVFSHQPVAMPDVMAFEECEELPRLAPVKWVGQYEFRFAEGAPTIPGKGFEEPQPARSAIWMRDRPERALDYTALAALGDSFLLRLFQVRGSIVPMGTVSLTTHFLATPDEIDEQAAAPLLGIADSMRFHGNFHDQQMQLWGRSGKLLAVGNQVVWYRQ